MLKLFKKIKYYILSKAVGRKIDRLYGCEASINIKFIGGQNPDGKPTEQIKIEITADAKDCKKLIDVLFTKGLK